MSKFYKRIFAILVAFTLTLSLLPSLRVNAADEVDSGTCGPNLTWSLDSEGMLTISGTGEMDNWSYNQTYKLIPTPWHRHMQSITSVTIEDGVTSIGDYLFHECTNLKTITIPNSVISIGKWAIFKCTSLENVTIPDSVTSIGNYAFCNCSNLNNITISDGVTSIGKKTFAGCGSLKSIKIPNSVTTIGEGTFEDCTSLETVTIPNSVTSISDNTFLNCTSLENVEIAAGVTSIGKQAFVSCSNLKSISIPDSVTSIDDKAFTGCTNLKSVLLPKNCSIGNNVFRNCSADIKLCYCYYATYISTGNGKITGNARTYSGDELTITPDTDYEVYQVTYKDANGKEGTIDTDEDGRYFMPDSDSSLEVTVSFKHITANVRFLSEDGKTELQSSPVDVNTVPSYEGEEPSKEPNSQYSYSFAGWTDGTNTYGPDEDLPVVTESVDYKAVFESKTNEYTIKFVDADGKVLKSESLEYGVTPSYEGATPVKSADEKYTYEFSGWSPEVTSVTGDATYEPIFESIINKYTIEFVDENGKVLQSESIEYGTTPTYNGKTPIKAEDDNYTYTFSGWSPVISSVTCDATYKAVFVSNAKSEPVTPSTPTPAPATPTPATPVPAPVNKAGTYYLKSMVEQDGDIVFTIKQSEDDSKTYDLLGTVSSDGTELTEGDQYTSAKGSAIITVKKSYLDTLNAGIHKLTVTFTDGGSITINYEIKAPAQETKSAEKPAETKASLSTGEIYAMTTPSGVVMIIISSCIALTALLRKRREIR